MFHNLHWLPVSSRIEFKIATLTFKVLKLQQPAYIFDLIAPYIPPWSLWFSNKNLLIVLDIWSEMGCRSFSFPAPKIWNSLPQHLGEGFASFAELCEHADDELFRNIQTNNHHVLHQLLPPIKNSQHTLRPRVHPYQIPSAKNNVLRNNYIYRMLYKDIY